MLIAGAGAGDVFLVGWLPCAILMFGSHGLSLSKCTT